MRKTVDQGVKQTNDKAAKKAGSNGKAAVSAKENEDLSMFNGLNGQNNRKEMTRREQEQYNEFIGERSKTAVTDEIEEYKTKIFDELRQIKKENDNEIKEHFQRLGWYGHDYTEIRDEEMK